jgi:phosphoribosylaminoimidazole-succinocarboxamide synthase
MRRLDEAKALCLDLFSRAARHARRVGLVLADTKFELGFVDGRAGALRRGADARLLKDLAGR